jgi:hypothetical protein
MKTFTFEPLSITMAQMKTLASEIGTDGDQL